MATLIVTNGSAAVNSIARVRPGDRFLPWDDVLHDGPVPSDLSLEHLSSIRARFISENGWASPEEAQERFKLRDLLILSARENFDEIVLWFEHDLYDQLQLAQILYILGLQPKTPSGNAAISLVCRDRFIAMTDPEILSLDFRDRELVTPEVFLAGINVWESFTHVTPERLLNLVHYHNLSVLPFARSAIYRLFDEYPNTHDGLSRTERAVLEAVDNGATDPVSLFKTSQEQEEAQFLGDASFWKILEGMNSEPDRLLRTEDGIRFDSRDHKNVVFGLTELGTSALDGTSGRVHTWQEKWVGGVLLGPRNFWYWDPQSEVFDLYTVAR